MADDNANSYLIGMIFGTGRFLRSLITDPSSEFRDLKWRIQYGGRQCKSYLIGMIFGARRFLRSLITNPSSEYINSKWRIEYGDLVIFNNAK